MRRKFSCQTSDQDYDDAVFLITTCWLGGRGVPYLRNLRHWTVPGFSRQAKGELIKLCIRVPYTKKQVNLYTTYTSKGAQVRLIIHSQWMFQYIVLDPNLQRVKVRLNSVWGAREYLG